jgi:pseudaminic acid synthase
MYNIFQKKIPFFIAELSGNHNQSLERALAIIEAAAEAGVDSVKLQTYTADSMTINSSNSDFMISDPASLWHGDNLYKLYQVAHTPWEWHEALYRRCRELGLICFSTPFDETAVDFLEQLNTPCYKIASFENNHLPLLKKVAATGKPVILSTGMASLAELDLAVRTLRESGCGELVLLKCTSTYPADPADSNLFTIPHMKELFQCPVGLSDHTPGFGSAVAAVALGAMVIEKHFTLARSDGGVDAAFSLEPAELKQLVMECRQAWQSLGGITYGPTENEKSSLKFRRSIYVVKDVKAGEVISEDNIRIIRPGYGLEPRYFEVIIGKQFTKKIPRGTALCWDHLLENDLN